MQDDSCSINDSASCSDEEYLNVIRKKVLMGGDVNMQKRHHLTALHVAAWKNDLTLVELLLQGGADIHAKVCGGRTPLHVAAEENASEATQLLLAKGAQVDARGRYGRTPLYLAVINKSLQAAEVLLAHGASPSFRDRRGRSLLHLTAMSGDARMTKVLLLYGSEVDSMDMKGKHLKDRVMHTCKAVLQELEPNGPTSHLSGEDREQYIEAQMYKLQKLEGAFSQGLTPLHYAAKYNQVEVAQVLLEHGADVDAKYECTGFYRRGDSWHLTPLLFATLHDHVRFAEVLIANGAEFKETKFMHGHTLLHVAVTYQSLGMVQLFLSQGMNADGYECLIHGQRYTRSPLQLACRVSHVKLSEELLAHGADVNTEYYLRGTPLVYALRAEPFSPDLIQVLFNSGAKIDEEVLRAAMNRGTELLKVMLDRAAADTKVDLVSTVLADASSPDIAKLLMSQGARITQASLASVTRFADADTLQVSYMDWDNSTSALEVVTHGHGLTDKIGGHSVL